MTIKPFANAGRFTTFENDIIDYIMPLCKPNTWKIVCATIRKTVGWHKEEDWISISQYMKLTGIVGRGTCHFAIKDAVKKDFIIQKKHKNSFTYSLNREYKLIVPKIGTIKNGTEIGTENVPILGNTKETSKDINSSNTDFSNVVKAWESLNGTISPFIADDLKATHEEIEHHLFNLTENHPDRIINASSFLKKAIEHMGRSAGKPNLNYLDKVVKNWMVNGVGAPPPGKRKKTKKKTKPAQLTEAMTEADIEAVRSK